VNLTSRQLPTGAGESDPFGIHGINSLVVASEKVELLDACTMDVKAPAPILTIEQQAEKGYVDALTHHLEAAARNMASLHQNHVAHHIVERVLDLCPYPLIAVNNRRRLECANTLATQLLKLGKVLHLVECEVRASKFAEAAFTKAMHAAEQSPLQVRQVVKLVPGPRPTVRLFINPLRQAESFRALGSPVHFLLLVYDLSNPLQGADPNLLADCFGLSPTEARVAVQLAQGAVIKQIAQAHRTSVSTVRSQVVSIFNKTGVRRQTDLVRLVAQLP
jgi:DNA-binding CsgD family transcriptional regulator